LICLRHFRPTGHEFLRRGRQNSRLLPQAKRATFLGYTRENGTAGTRNYIAIVSSVNCSATVAKAVAAHYGQPERLAAYPNINGVLALTHAGGGYQHPD
jgi:galactarate dehydratase